MEDFKVETKGLCFLCLDKIDPKLFPLKTELRSESFTPSSVHALQSFSRYLKMDVAKVFDEEGHVPQELLAKVKRARLKVELCGECASLNQTFMELYRQLEKIQMEMASHLDRIRQKLLRESSQLMNLSKTDQNKDEVEDARGKLKIVKVLRNEANLKCSSKIRNLDSFNVKLQKWTVKQIDSERGHINSTSTSQRPLNSNLGTEKKFPEEEFCHEAAAETVKDEVKEEESSSSQFLEDNDTGNDHFDDNDAVNVALEQPPSLVGPSMMMMTSSSVNLIEGPEATASNYSTETEWTATMFEREGSSYKCKVCTKTFSSKGPWLTHYKSIHLKIKYKCNLCGMEFNVKGNYTRHHQSVHVGVRFKCLVCSKMCTRKEKLIRHQKKGGCKAGKSPK